VHEALIPVPGRRYMRGVRAPVEGTRLQMGAEQ
jgi:hypothetical protein